MSHIATLSFALLVGMAVVTATAGGFIWMRVRASGARVLALLLLACAMNSGLFGLEFATSSLAAKGALEKLLIASAVAIPTLWFVFALEYTGRGRYVTRTMIALLCVVPVLSFLLAVTNDAHQLFWLGVSLTPGDVYLAPELAFGPAYWLHIAYSNLLLAAGTVVLLQLFWRSWNLYRGQAVALLVAVLLPWLAQSLYVGGLSPVYGIEVNVSLCIAALLLAVGFDRLRIADVLTVSRSAILDSLIDAVMVLDPDARMLYSNPAGTAFLERLGPEPAPEALTRVWPRVFEPRPNDPARVAAISWTADDGSVFDLTMSPVAATGGPAVAKLLVARDVTEQRRAEQALEESQKRLEETYRLAHIGIWSWTVASDVVTWSEELYRIAGRDPDLPAPTYAEHPDVYTPESWDRLRTAVEQALKHGTDCELELELICPDGTTRWVNAIGGATCDDQGRVEGLYGTIQDITTRKQAEIEVRRQTEQLRRTVEGTVLAMSQIVETRDPYTAGHERRVAELATAIAERMGMRGEEVTTLRLGATIHDIGKIGVPAEILSKPGRLSEIEFELIRRHPAVGFDIVEAIGFDLPVAELVRQHHERLDGSGYPDGLTNNEILLEARILAVADVVEAMASHRPYRPAQGMDVALAEIREHAGVTYDADVVAACLQLIEEQGFGFTP